jgi:hypothetical protein
MVGATRLRGMVHYWQRLIKAALMKPPHLVWRANVGAIRPRGSTTRLRRKPRSQRWAHTLIGKSSSSWPSKRRVAPKRSLTHTTHSNWQHPRIWEGLLEAASGRIRSKARGHLASKSRWKIGLLGPHRPRGCIRSTHPRKGTFIHRISFMSLLMCPTTSHWGILARTLHALMLKPMSQKRRI